MLRLDKVIKPWKEAASLNDHINLYGFWDETTFLTKSGDVGMVLSVPGVDYESLDHAQQEYAVKRLEAALKAFGPGFHVYQYLFKSNRPEIPFTIYDDPIVNAATEQRRQFFEAKHDHLYQVEIFYAIVLEGPRSKSGVGAAFAQLFRDPAGAIGELRTQFTNDSMKVLLRSQIENELARLEQKIQAFIRQLADFMQIEVLGQQAQFRFFRRLLNYDEWRIGGKSQSTQFLDYQVVNSNIEAERDHLRVGDHIVRVLTMKEAITETKPLVLDALLKIPANFYVVTEWTPLATDKARKEVNKRRRHFNMSKTGFVSQMSDAVPTPTAILSTSPGKYQVLWRVDGFDFERQETMLKLLAIAFGGDPACTDCNRVLRIPGFLNRKYDPAHRVTVEYPCDAVWNPGDFRLEIPATQPSFLPPPNGARKPPHKHTHSEHDWAWITHELGSGKDAVKLTRELASRRSDKPNPLYYAQRTVDVASARLWLIEGIRVDDVITMLESRRRFEIPAALCSARAREIATTAQRMIVRRKLA